MKFYQMALTSALLFSLNVSAQTDTFEITIENHQFKPNIVKIKAQKKVTLLVTNKDKEMEEFDSSDLNREVILGPDETQKIIIGPLNPGTYTFIGEFHSETARGTLVVEK